MLTGQYAHTLDAKGRVNFPARLREELGPRFFITRGLDNCLFVYSPEEWQALADKLSKLPMSKSTPLSRLRKYAGLEKEITIAGVSSRAEIWDTARWEANNLLLTPEAIAEAMDEMGF